MRRPDSDLLWHSILMYVYLFTVGVMVGAETLHLMHVYFQGWSVKQVGYLVMHTASFRYTCRELCFAKSARIRKSDH